MSSEEFLETRIGDASGVALHKLVRKVEEVHTTLRQHLGKEEEQLLPLLLEHFSFDEQADLVLQFLCCIPYSAIKPMLKWLKHSVSRTQQELLLNQVMQAVKDPWLKQMVQSWLAPTDDGETHHDNQGADEPQTPSGSEFVCCGCSPCTTPTQDEADFDVEDANEAYAFVNRSQRPPLREIVYFHEAIRSAMRSFAKEAQSLHASSELVSPGQLQALAGRHRFIRAVCQFHSASEDEVVFPVLHRVLATAEGNVSKGRNKEASGADTSTLYLHKCEEDHVTETARFEELGRLLGDVRACARRGAKEVSELTGELSVVSEKLSRSMSSHMTREETDILPVLMNSLCAAEQRHIVWKLVQAMPLRLLERFMPWIAAKIPGEDVNEWLKNIRKASSPSQKPLVQLLIKWASRSKGKNKTLDAIDDPAAYPVETCGSNIAAVSVHMIGDSLDNKRKVTDPGAMNLKKIRTNTNDTNTLEGSSPQEDGITRHPPVGLRNPIDHIFQFHKALRQELKDLEEASIDLQETAASSKDWNSTSGLDSMIQELQTRFEFLRGIYKAHSRAEDIIVFPALESKEKLHNVSHAYSLDHQKEESLFEEVSAVVSEIGICVSSHSLTKLKNLSSKLSRMCAAIRASLETHVRAEEKELWPLFTEHFTIEEQQNLVGVIIGQTGAEVLHVMLSWVTKSMTEDESDAMMMSLKDATKSTAFEKWLGAAQNTAPSISPRSLQSSGGQRNEQIVDLSYAASPSQSLQQEEQKTILAEVAAYLAKHSISGSSNPSAPSSSQWTEPSSLDADSTLFRPGWEDIFRMNQKQLESAVRRVSADPNLEPQRKAYLIQHLMASRYIVAQQKRNAVLKEVDSVDKFLPNPKNVLVEKSPKESLNNPSADSAKIELEIQCYHDKAKKIPGCKHYARNNILISPCCGNEYVCRLCHDEQEIDHKMDRYNVREMRCMLCGTRQDVKNSCEVCNATMASYYCNICHLFDDDTSKDIYHCPFCNFCRRGKGLGKDSFHCMSCNACMSLELFNKHTCTEAALSGTCPVCSDPLFESKSAIKELPCGHFMHSLCFGAYVRYSYTCPICTKSLGDMEVYWKMIDAMLLSEKLPIEYARRKQTVRCHDCGTVTEAPFHFVYHKCTGCHGYNTRLIVSNSNNLE